jgi:transcription antitermination factor NusG
MEPGNGAVLSNRQRRLMRQSRVQPDRHRPMTEVIRPQMMETRFLIEPENLRWFVLRVESTSEEALIRVMDLIGIPAAIPTVPKERVRRGRMFRWRAPVASGYVLIGFPGTASIPWWEIKRFRIVYDPLRDDQGNPVQVPWECTYADKDTIRNGGVKTLLADFEAVRIGAAKYVRSRPTFEANETVRVQEGPFAGLEGKVQEVVGSAAIVLLNILGRQTPANMPLEHIVRAA